MIRPAMLVFLIPVLFGVVGGVMAANRGRNFIGWALLSALFPIFVLIVWFEKPLKEVEGHFRRCSSCGQWIKWLENPCRYCRAEQTPRS